MKKSNFFEGFILGAIAGVVTSLFFLDSNEKSTPIEKNTTSSADSENESTETRVQKTLDAIEKGFDKLSKMVNDSKNIPTQKPKSTNTKQK